MDPDRVNRKTGKDVDETTASKKADLLEQAMALQAALIPDHPDIRVIKFNDAKPYSFTENKLPAYFFDKWNSTQNTDLESDANFYPYTLENDCPPSNVDYANQVWGGGWKGPRGFAQEEIMFMQTPALASLGGWLVNNQVEMRTRHGRSPDPIIITGLMRVQGVDEITIPNNDPTKRPKIAYGRGIENLSSKEVLQRTSKMTEAQKYTMLAIAAPDLSKVRNPEAKYAPTNLKDIFNTIVAGTDLHRKVITESDAPIHTGGFGTGVFGQSREVVYFMHKMAKGVTGQRYIMHGYSEYEISEYNKTWNEIEKELDGKTINECLEFISDYLIKKKH